MTVDFSAAFVQRPEPMAFEPFHDARAAVNRLIEIYARNTAQIRAAFQDVVNGRDLAGPARACYPAIRIAVATYDPIDTRLSFGHVAEPGVYQTTVTQPDLDRKSVVEQIGLLLQNHGAAGGVGGLDSA